MAAGELSLSSPLPLLLTLSLLLILPFHSSPSPLLLTLSLLLILPFHSSPSPLLLTLTPSPCLLYSPSVSLILAFSYSQNIELQIQMDNLKKELAEKDALIVQAKLVIHSASSLIQFQFHCFVEIEMVFLCRGAINAMAANHAQELKEVCESDYH